MSGGMSPSVVSLDLYTFDYRLVTVARFITLALYMPVDSMVELVVSTLARFSYIHKDEVIRNDSMF